MKKLLSIGVGLCLCLAVVGQVKAFDLFGIFLSDQGPYTAGGVFITEEYMKEYLNTMKAEQEQRATVTNYALLPIEINGMNIQVDDEGNVTGQGRLSPVGFNIGGILFETGKYQPLSDAHNDFRMEFMGRAQGNNLSGKVKENIYVYNPFSMELAGVDIVEQEWKAVRNGNVVKGELVYESGRVMPFELQVGEEVETGLDENKEDEEVEEEEVVEEVEEEEVGVEPNMRNLKLKNINGQLITNGTVRITKYDGTIEEVELVDGQFEYDANSVRNMTVRDNDTGNSISVRPDSLRGEDAIMASENEWMEKILPDLQEMATIMNGGKEVNIEDIFEIDTNASEDSFVPTTWLLKLFGVKNKINFSAEGMAKLGNAETAMHEAVGHGITETVGDNNSLRYAGGAHDDPWQPGYKERSKLNPARWFGDDNIALSDQKAKGLAFSEGWAQYVGDKWQRRVTGVADEDSEFTTENAIEKMTERRGGTAAKMYEDDPYYGAKVENTVATVFNELYTGMSMEDAVADYTQTRKEYKSAHYDKPPETINQFLDHKLQNARTDQERLKIKTLMQKLSIEAGSPFAPGEEPVSDDVGS